MYDLKIPWNVRTQILIVKKELQKEVGKKHITHGQAERFLAEYMIRELHVISGKEAAKEEVLTFIDDFLENNDIIWKKFRAGYFYYFAVMLKDAFQRGEVCWCAPYGHICWLDDNGVPYDIEGVCDSECELYIPVSYICEGIADFKHVPDKVFDASAEYIENAVSRFCEDVVSQVDMI